MLSKLFAVENIQGDPFVSLMVLGNWCLKGHSECTSAIKKKKTFNPSDTLVYVSEGRGRIRI